MSSPFTLRTDSREGKHGTIKRINYGIHLLENGLSPFHLGNYHIVLFAAVESDIDVCSMPNYNKANIVAYQYHSLEPTGIMSRGPAVQPEFFDMKITHSRDASFCVSTEGVHDGQQKDGEKEGYHKGCRKRKIKKTIAGI